MKGFLLGLAAFLVSSLMLAAAVFVLSHLVGGGDERGLSVGSASNPVLAEEDLLFSIEGDPRRIEGPLAGELANGSYPSTLVLSPGALSPGLHTLSWAEQYMGRRPRRAQFTVLSGPFESTGSPVRCGASLALGIGTLDPVVRGIEEEVGRALGEIRMLPRATSVSVSPYFVEGGIDVMVDVYFREGSSIHSRIPLSLEQEGRSRLVVGRRGAIDVRISGSLGAAASLYGGGLGRALESLGRRDGRGLSGAIEAAREAGEDVVAGELEGQVDAHLPMVNEEIGERLPRSVNVGLGGADVALDLSFCEQPSVEGEALVLRFDVATRVSLDGGAPVMGERDRGAMALGPVVTRGSRPAPRLDLRRNEAVLTLSEDLFNSISYEAWAAGGMGDLAGDKELVEGLNSEMAAFSSLSITGAGLDLPPVLTIEESGAKARLGELRFTMEDLEEGAAPDLVAAASAALEIEAVGGGLFVSARVSSFEACCSEIVDEIDLRRPCLSELLHEASLYLRESGPEVSFEVPLEGLLGDLPARLAGVEQREGALDLVALFDDREM